MGSVVAGQVLQVANEQVIKSHKYDVIKTSTLLERIESNSRSPISFDTTYADLQLHKNRIRDIVEAISPTVRASLRREITRKTTDSINDLLAPLLISEHISRE